MNCSTLIRLLILFIITLTPLTLSTPTQLPLSYSKSSHSRIKSLKSTLSTRLTTHHSIISTHITTLLTTLTNQTTPTTPSHLLHTESQPEPNHSKQTIRILHQDLHTLNLENSDLRMRIQEINTLLIAIRTEISKMDIFLRRVRDEMGDVQRVIREVGNGHDRRGEDL